MLWHPKTLQNLAMYNVFFIFGRFSIAGKLPKWPKIPFQYPLALRHPNILEKCRKHHRILVSVRNRFWPPPAKADIATAILTNVIEHLVLLLPPNKHAFTAKAVWADFHEILHLCYEIPTLFGICFTGFDFHFEAQRGRKDGQANETKSRRLCVCLCVNSVSTLCQLCVYVHIWPELKPLRKSNSLDGSFPVKAEDVNTSALSFDLHRLHRLSGCPGHFDVANSPVSTEDAAKSDGWSLDFWQVEDVSWRSTFGLVILVRSSKWQGEARWQKGKGPLFRNHMSPKWFNCQVLMDVCKLHINLTFAWHSYSYVFVKFYTSDLVCNLAPVAGGTRDGCLRADGVAEVTRCRLSADSVQIMLRVASVRPCETPISAVIWFAQAARVETKNSEDPRIWDCLVKLIKHLWIFLKPGNVHGICHMHMASTDFSDLRFHQ